MSSKGWRRVVMKCMEMAPRNTRMTSRTRRDLAMPGILCFTPGAGSEVERNGGVREEVGEGEKQVSPSLVQITNSA